MLVLSETVLVLVIESNLYRCYVRSTQELTLNATKLVLVSEDGHEHEHEHEHGVRVRVRQWGEKLRLQDKRFFGNFSGWF